MIETIFMPSALVLVDSQSRVKVLVRRLWRLGVCEGDGGGEGEGGS